MHVSNICSRNAITVRRSDELVKAAQLMREKHIGFRMHGSRLAGEKLS